MFAIVVFSALVELAPHCERTWSNPIWRMGKGGVMAKSCWVMQMLARPDADVLVVINSENENA